MLFANCYHFATLAFFQLHVCVYISVIQENFRDNENVCQCCPRLCHHIRVHVATEHFKDG